VLHSSYPDCGTAPFSATGTWFTISRPSLRKAHNGVSRFDGDRFGRDRHSDIEALTAGFLCLHHW
jgi:hypothetical protein